MIKSVKNGKVWLFNQSWYVRNISSKLPIQDKKQSNSSMEELYENARKPSLGFIMGIWYAKRR
jgi:ABC-type Fe3+-hydroxamate transport system substrate-binding protein